MHFRILKMIVTGGFLAAFCSKFVFGLGSAPDPAGELTALPRPLAGLRGRTSKGRVAESKGKGRRGGSGKEAR